MRSITLILITLLLNYSNYGMIARARNSRPIRPLTLRQSLPSMAKRAKSYLVQRTVRLERQYPETQAFWEAWDSQKYCFKEPPLNSKAFSVIGKQVFCHLVALQIIHQRHMQKHAKGKGFLGHVLTPQEEADELLTKTIDSFSKAFINPHPATNSCSGIYQEDEETLPTTDKQLVHSIKHALESLEKSFSDPHDKI